MVVLMMMFVSTTVAMMVFVMMCHVFCIYLFLGAKVGKRCCNSVAKCSAHSETEGEDTDADTLDGCKGLNTGCERGTRGTDIVNE